MLTGDSNLLLHLGDPTHSFRAPMIYNPWFERAGIDAWVVPLGVRASEFRAEFGLLMQATNVRGALITMPHKVTVLDLVDEIGPAATIAGAANGVRVEADGRLVADMFDGEGFVRGMRRNGYEPRGRSALVVGSGGVGSAIAASLAAAGVHRLALSDTRPAAMDGLAERLGEHHPALEVQTGGTDPTDFEIVVNATPLGMRADDPLPLPVERLAPGTFVGEVVMTRTMTPFLRAAQQRGCLIQVGTDMLFEQIPAYLEFFGFAPLPTPAQLREYAELAG